MAIEVVKVELKTVQDASGLDAYIGKGQFTADQVIAVIGKTEGNGGASDFYAPAIGAEHALAHVAAGSPGPAAVAGGLSLDRTGGGMLRGIQSYSSVPKLMKLRRHDFFIRHMSGDDSEVMGKLIHAGYERFRDRRVVIRQIAADQLGDQFRFRRRK